MKIITVSGSNSGVGKTTFVEKILRQHKNWSALKVTVVKDGPCPRKAPCGVCDGLKTSFSIISKPSIIGQIGKDTQRMKAAGAKKVLWLKAKPSGLKKGLKTALGMFKNTKALVIEGTSVLKHLKPDFKVFIRPGFKIRCTRSAGAKKMKVIADLTAISE